MIRVKTSGSTGIPKVIELSEALVEASARRTIRFFGLNSGSRLHLCLSTDHIAGIMMEQRAQLCGATLTREVPTSAPCRQMMAADEITLLAVVGTQLAALRDKQQEGTLPRIKHLLVGGSPLLGEWRRIAATLAEHAWESYGMTETASHIALRPVRANEDIPEPFHLLEGIKVSQTSDGRLIIKMAELEEALVTNDVVEMTGTDSFRVLGRADGVIITGGKKVHPEHVEEVLADFITSPFAITSRPDPKWGEEVILVVEDDTLPELEELCNFVGSRLQKWERPKAIIGMTKIPRTATGKISRCALRGIYNKKPIYG